MKRECELCKRPARIHCESDQASLCWDCDAKVHSANFLVAKHSRSLLCRLCQSPTPWSAAGSKLEPTFSHCRKCARTTDSVEEQEEVVENKVVPWSPPPPESSLSGVEAVATRKRGRLGNDRNDLHNCTKVEVASGADSTLSRGIAAPPRKIGRTNPAAASVRSLCEETASSKDDTLNDAVDLNLSLSLLSR